MAKRSFAALCAGAAIGLAVSGQAAEDPKWPAPKPPADISRFGTGIQRTMTLLATSTPTHRNTVRILFYGQSITEMWWTHTVADWLRAKYPNANLIIENRAIGGFETRMLVKTCETDVYPFYPDLMIFQDYFSTPDDTANYEGMVADTRKRTTSEILLQTEHFSRDQEVNEETDPAKLLDDDHSLQWRNYVFLPGVAKKYGAELLDIRTEWRQYLLDNHLEPGALLEDGVHTSDWGDYVMAKLVEERLVYRPELSDAGWRDMISTYQVGRDLQWSKGRLTLSFEGNRLDVIAAPGPGVGARAQVLIDGKKPSQFPELYTFTRANAAPGVWWPALIGIHSQKPLLVEDWRARFFNVSDDLTHFSFEVIGSKTGPDGQGSSDQRFVSNSGRVVIDPSDWWLAAVKQGLDKRPMPADYEVTWKVVPLFLDEYVAPAVTDQTIEATTTVAQALSNGKHTLMMVAEGDRLPSIQAIRVYRPPVR